MSEHVKETAAQVADLIPKYSWELMDEEQRDALMQEVVLPRYMKTTSDEVQMGPKFWGETVGATASAIKNRVSRLQRQGSSKDGVAIASATTEIRQRQIVKKMARENPEAITKDPEARKAIEAQLAKESKQRYEKMRKRQDERDKQDPSKDRLERLGHVLDVEVALGKAEGQVADALEFHYLPHPEEFSETDREEFAADLQDIIDVASGFKTIITTGDLSLAGEVLGFVRKPKEEVK